MLELVGDTVDVSEVLLTIEDVSVVDVIDVGWMEVDVVDVPVVTLDKFDVEEPNW